MAATNSHHLSGVVDAVCDADARMQAGFAILATIVGAALNGRHAQ
jgi:hypothetical protein